MIINQFTELIKAELCKETPQLNKEILNQAELVGLYKLSSNHDLTHMVASALKKQGILGDDHISKAFEMALKVAAYRYETMNFVLEQVKDIFEKEGIIYVPLKGADIEKYYPEKWMRTRSDLDILVKDEDIKRAKELLVSELGYKVHKHNYHDIALLSPEGILVELHFRILEHEGNIDKVLDKVWNFVVPVETQDVSVKSRSCEYKLTNEFNLFYVYAHMYYHFIKGGCGLRFLADIWLMESQMELDQEVLQRLYKESNLEVFAKYTRKLARICFGQGHHDQITLMMLEYILTGGLFGSFESKVKARKTITKGKKRYILGRFFMPLNELQASYPVLEKYPVLYPVYTVKRWTKIFSGQTREAAVSEIKLNNSMKQDSVDQLRELFAVLKGEKNV